MKLVLAPMEGLVDDVMRDVLTRIGGIDMCVTEFVRVTSALLPTRTFMRLAPELERAGNTRAGVPVRVQLLGSDAACLAENGAKAASLGASGVDLNFGCPAPTVNRHRGGAVLLNEPELLHEIVAAVRRAVPAAIPVTAKMRLGYEDKSRALECALAIESAGAGELTVHGRTKVEGYRPPAHWDWIARIRETVAIPVIANGEVWTLDDYRAIRAESGCDTVMIGRGLVACPDLAARIVAGGPAAPMDWGDMMPWVLDFFRQCWSKSGENRYPVARLKQWLGLLKRTWPEAEQLFEAIRREQEPEKIDNILMARLGK
ncbi:tRNA-dihydrouridine synthase [Chromobacterium subtsugae]|uniref:tRNA-dihydrouridine(16) synthase n=1 Tax=Chromobacterium subtsugae TaxID=251747 RepID=A0ABS7FED7_9NEIS|nr:MULTISPECIES: tRNA-dihydrouridine synthase [Chromobacterium]KUM04842.1 tRNA-dihydrouridine synthase C [Chromobacterium subtsugae]KZE87756.1 tRNA-dihydrouridine synthase C [Chromobacterium sp. F49]MBW7568235.1 tRNA-dihydrouridine synthase [Chromobacterium subtsugae]MBW8288435.1 tRNA-dihydrouridine synthase [Chromobacterium subtsugae]WSE89955.1 tRNA-dihydrouridine synthase [Chromobacterium subtsugae]